MRQTRYREQTWTDPRQAFRTSPTHGVGAFATAPFAKGDVVEVIGGVVMDNAAFQRFAAEHPRFNAIQIDEDRHLVERPEVTAQRTGGSLNHACDSSLWMQDEVTLVARRDIAAGEELTVDYALFTVDPAWQLDDACGCGVPACRGTVTGNDWQRPDVQERYRGHFSPFINRRIERDA